MTEVPVNVAYLRGQVDHYKALFEECALARDSAGYVGSVPDCIQTMHNELNDTYSAIKAIWFALDGCRDGVLDGVDLDEAIYSAAELIPPAMRGDRELPAKKVVIEKITDDFEDLLG